MFLGEKFLRSSVALDFDRRYLPLVPAIGFVLVVFVIPVSYLVGISFFHYSPSEIYVGPLTLENYITFLTDSWYQQWIVYTLRLGFLVTVSCILLGYPIGYQMAHSSKRVQQLLMFVVLIPLMVGSVVRTYGWMVIAGRNGLINEVVLNFRDEPIELLGTTNLVVIGVIGIVLPFMVFPI